MKIEWRKTASKRIRAAILLSHLVFVTQNGWSSETVLPLGAEPCEADWIRRSQFDKVGSVAQLSYWEYDAERGVVAMQLRLGFVLSSADGKWTAPADRSYNIKWLEKAKAQGSRTAAYELAQIRVGRREITQEEFFRSAIEAAETERNPWAATELMDFTSGRLGINKKPTDCYKDWWPDGKCAPSEILEISSARKWAEIAAEGGNAAAEEWLCWSAQDGNTERGQPQDDKAALKWCHLAMHNACSYRSVDRYLSAVRRVEGLSAFEEASKKLMILANQPWRFRTGRFFNLVP